MLWTIVCFFSALFIMFLPILCNFVTCCFDLIACCSSALFMMNSTFNPSCGDDGSVNVNVCVYVCVCVCVWVWENIKVNFRLSDYYDYDHQCKWYQRTRHSITFDNSSFENKKPHWCKFVIVVNIIFIFVLWLRGISGLTGLSECSYQRDMSNITLELSENHVDTCSNSVAGTWRLVNI